MRFKLSKRYLLILAFPINLLWSLQKAWIESSESLNIGTNKDGKCQTWPINTKPFFWENESNLETFQTFSLYIVASYKFVLKSVKGLNKIFWVIEYWYKALKCPSCSTNTKPFFRESETIVETSQFCSQIEVSYK